MHGGQKMTTVAILIIFILALAGMGLYLLVQAEWFPSVLALVSAVVMVLGLVTELRPEGPAAEA